MCQQIPGLCHGSHTVSCAGCGLVAPCARPDCRSCGPDLGVARERRANKEKWFRNGTINQCVFATIPIPKKKLHRGDQCHCVDCRAFNLVAYWDRTS